MTLTSEMTAAIGAEVLRPVVLVEIDFTSMPVRMWSGLGPLTWGGVEWMGLGDLGSISPVREGEGIEPHGLTLELSGVPPELLGLALSEPYQGRHIAAWLGLTDSAGALLPGPKQLFAGRLDIMEVEDSADSAVIRVTAESRLVDLLKPREWRYTHEDQQIHAPGDLGLEFVAALQNKEINWVPT
ncbi:MAG: hypothetical protein ACNA7Q_12085 [Rhodobacterales bacterium]